MGIVGIFSVHRQKTGGGKLEALVLLLKIGDFQRLVQLLALLISCMIRGELFDYWKPIPIKWEQKRMTATS